MNIENSKWKYSDFVSYFIINVTRDSNIDVSNYGWFSYIRYFKSNKGAIKTAVINVKFEKSDIGTKHLHDNSNKLISWLLYYYFANRNKAFNCKYQANEILMPTIPLTVIRSILKAQTILNVELRKIFTTKITEICLKSPFSK